MFQVAFVLQNAPRGGLALDGLALGGVIAEESSAKFDLMLSVRDAEHGLVASMTYSVDLFDDADERIRYLVDHGIMPCIVGAWGYFLPWMGEKRMQQHWRYLIARYGALPVVWCTAGEANLPWYLAKGFPFDDREQTRGWTAIMKYIREAQSNVPVCWFRRITTDYPQGLANVSGYGEM